MKANELRIGNFVASGVSYSKTSSIGKVLEIGNLEREFEQIYCECEESFDWFFKDNYCGIPLTEEWLLKFGFDKKDKSYIKNSFLFINNNSIYKFLYKLSIIESEVKYVHQLQNLYFALTGEELTIEKP